jgi:hypothetical protein
VYITSMSHEKGASDSRRQIIAKKKKTKPNGRRPSKFF